ncbi:GntR family transcriptional regulator [Gemmiger sp. An50]|uniref:GntR family transcriptional regulator n=1 Tax=Gemmiger sp. An50 TaxID=1965639 RepID=UPI000B3AF334|nr:GntR family transcriptional regulator [Gemmiger sp. An50]OUN83608.1 GntR family transcriptional regulator [Gemmiger sp. An50]
MKNEECALQIANTIKEKIHDKTYNYGTPLPSEREFAELFHVSRNIIRAAIEHLEEEKLVKRIRGKGTFVTKTNIDDSSIHFKGMTELLHEAGYTPSSKVLKTQTREAGYKFSKIFHVPEEEKIFQIIRLRKGNDQPISIENTYLPFNSVKGIESIDFQVYSLYDVLTINKIKIHDIQHIFSASKVYNTFSKLLACSEGNRVISIQITSSTIEGTIAEYTEVMVVPEFAKYYTDGVIRNGEFHLSSQII